MLTSLTIISFFLAISVFSHLVLQRYEKFLIKARKGEVYFKDIFFVNIWKLALARGFDEDDRTEIGSKGVAEDCETVRQ